MFVLRDYDHRIEFQKIKNMLDADLKRIWSEIYKPDKYAESKPEDFFEFEFAMMPHKIFEEANFMNKAAELKARFQVGAENSLFLANKE